MPRTSLPTNSSYFSSVRLSTVSYASNPGETCHTPPTSTRVYADRCTSPVAIDESNDDPTYVAVADSSSAAIGDQCATRPRATRAGCAIQPPVDAIRLRVFVTLPSSSTASPVPSSPASSTPLRVHAMTVHEHRRRARIEVDGVAEFAVELGRAPVRSASARACDNSSSCD